MIAVTSFRNETVAVLGLARSGLAAARALAAGGARVMAWDDAEGARANAASQGVSLVDLAQADLAGVNALVLSPGIPHTFPAPHPVAARARAARIPLIGDIELLARSVTASRYVGVTGTNGKSTTTALIAHLLRTGGRHVQAGGNIGVPALLLDTLGADGTYVLEMSSYQLELTESLAFDVAVMLNVTLDHLDRHGGMAGYVAAKERIFRHQSARQFAVVGSDDDFCRAMIAKLAGAKRQRVVPVSARHAVAGGVYATEGVLVDDMDGKAQRIVDLASIEHLPGRHNWQNAAAAFAAARCLGLSADAAARGLQSFAGLAHRQETIAVIDGVRFVNDSKATNADSVANALACYGDVYWIAGGKAKEGGIAALAPFFPRIRHAFLIGEAAPDFAATLGRTVPYTIAVTLEEAVAAAHAAARGRTGATVLLSPACASFDQFRDFEARGRRFRALVEALPGARQ
jgi:UDP-N-acetylmuramoylalanine--D-glutamate ligase